MVEKGRFFFKRWREDVSPPLTNLTNKLHREKILQLSKFCRHMQFAMRLASDIHLEVKRCINLSEAWHIDTRGLLTSKIWGQLALSWKQSTSYWGFPGTTTFLPSAMSSPCGGALGARLLVLLSFHDSGSNTVWIELAVAYGIKIQGVGPFPTFHGLVRRSKACSRTTTHTQLHQMRLP